MRKKARARCSNSTAGGDAVPINQRYLLLTLSMLSFAVVTGRENVCPWDDIATMLLPGWRSCSCGSTEDLSSRLMILAFWSLLFAVRSPSCSFHVGRRLDGSRTIRCINSTMSLNTRVAPRAKNAFFMENCCTLVTAFRSFIFASPVRQADFLRRLATWIRPSREATLSQVRCGIAVG